jgi:protein required for attachment to host cells
MSPVWVAVLSQREMKLFERDLENKELKYIRSVVNELEGKSDQDISRHKPGVVSEGGRGVARHVMTAGVSPHDIAIRAYVRRIAKELETNRTQGHLTELIVIAEPRIMGMIKSHFKPPMQKIVSQWIPKDLEKATTSIVSDTVSQFSPW